MAEIQHSFGFRPFSKTQHITQIGNLKIMTLNQGHLSKLFKSLSEKYTSIPKLAKTILNTSMRYALDKRLIMNNPCTDVDLPKQIKKDGYHTIVVEEARTYNLEQVKLLLEASKDSRIHMQILFALLMGLRKSEPESVNPKGENVLKIE